MDNTKSLSESVKFKYLCDQWKVFLESMLFANMPISSVAPAKANITKLRREIPNSNYLVTK
jgi:hypothetical protein